MAHNAEAPRARRRARCFGVCSGPMAWHASLSFWRVSATASMAFGPEMCNYKITVEESAAHAAIVMVVSSPGSTSSTHTARIDPGWGDGGGGHPPPFHCLNAPALHQRKLQAPRRRGRRHNRVASAPPPPSVCVRGCIRPRCAPGDAPSPRQSPAACSPQSAASPPLWSFPLPSCPTDQPVSASLHLPRPPALRTDCAPAVPARGRRTDGARTADGLPVPDRGSVIDVGVYAGTGAAGG